MFRTLVTWLSRGLVFKYISMITQPDFEIFLAGLKEEKPGTVINLEHPGFDNLKISWGKDRYQNAYINGVKNWVDNVSMRGYSGGYGY